MGTIDHTRILDAAGIVREPFSLPGGASVLLTMAHQLVAPYGVLRKAQASSPPYRGWQSHHIVEHQDLVRLGLVSRFPPYEELLCVLIPERAHIGRINSQLRRHAPMGASMGAHALLGAYAAAYDLVGDYCGAPPGLVRKELMAIVRATFRLAGAL